MAFISFIPKLEALGSLDDQVLGGLPATVSSNCIVQGSDYLRIFTVKRTVSGVDVAVDCSEWIGTVPKCDFRDKPIGELGITTGYPQPTMSWLNSGVGGQIQMFMPRANTIGLALAFLKGVYSIEITHSGGLISEVFYGPWFIKREITS